MYKRSKKLSMLSFVVCFMLSLSLLSGIAFAETNPDTAASQINRLSGSDRYETAVKVSQSGWQTSDYVVIARGDDFADALSAGPLAKKNEAPILLTETNRISDGVLNEISRLKAKNILIVGGPGAVSASVETKLKAIKINNESVKVERVFGSDRFETSVAVANEMGGGSDIVLATGYNYPDALSIAPIAASKGMPILLTEKDALPKSVSDYLNENKDSIEKTFVIGGTGVIGEKVEDAVKNPIRLGGNDRYETNVLVMAAFMDEIDFENIFVALGDGPTNTEFADALSGAVLAAKTVSPVVLMYNEIPATTKKFLTLTSSQDAKITALGGTAVVPQKSVESLAGELKTPVIISTLGTTATRGIEKPFQVVTLAKDAAGEMVKVKVTLLSGSDLASVEYKESADNKYYPLSFNENGQAWYGPESGFPLTDAASDFKVLFNKAGTVEYKLEVISVDDNKVLASYQGSVEATAQALEGDDASAYVLPTNFNTNLSDLYVGYNVGWKLTDNINLSDIESMEVSLLDKDDNVLVTNVGTDKIAALSADTTEFSTAFNVNRDIDFTDEYWTLGAWENGTQQPVKAEIKLTNKNGDTYTVVNNSLAVVAGDEDVAKYLDSYKALNLNGDDAKAYVTTQNFNTHFNLTNSLDYVGFNVGWKLTDKVKLSEVKKMEVSLLDEKGNVLVTNTSTDKILTLPADTVEFSTPFNVNFHINYADEYWTFGKWANGVKEPSKAQIKVTTIYGDTFTVVNDSLAKVAGTEALDGYLK